ncbi:MAG: NADPH-dependent F420 reductase [Theionarchaea archaeon]|nr:NADPH-dependent F420 reductase [Theionarchaea archaeon]MBU7037484.1 NADPH-dependent F420 reductase [Theionarchaea archaeon]
MKKIAIIGGTGDLGYGLALRWAKAGREIIIGSRQEEKAVKAAEEIRNVLGDSVTVSGMGNFEATKNAQITVLSVPFQFLVPTMRQIRDAIEEGDILISVIVPLAVEIGGFSPTQVVTPWQGSAAELVQSLAPPGAQVVSAFQNMSAFRLQDTDNEVDCDAIVSGPKTARKEVIELAGLIPGVRGIDGGRLDYARLVEPITALLIGLNIRYKNREGIGIRFTYVNEEI